MAKQKYSKRDEKIISRIIDELNCNFDKSHKLHRKSRSVESVYRMLIEKSIAYKKDVSLAQIYLSRRHEIKNKKFVLELVACTIGGLSDNAYCFGTSHRVVKEPALELSNLLNNLGVLGRTSKLTNSKNIIGKCAEVKAANGLLLGSNGLLLNRIKFTSSIRPRTLEKKARCANCENVFGEE